MDLKLVVAGNFRIQIGSEKVSIVTLLQWQGFLQHLHQIKVLECLARDDFVGDNLVNVFAAHQLFRKRLFKAGRLGLGC